MFKTIFILLFVYFSYKILKSYWKISIQKEARKDNHKEKQPDIILNNNRKKESYKFDAETVDFEEIND